MEKGVSHEFTTQRRRKRNLLIGQNLYLNSFGFVQLLSHFWLCDPMDCSISGFPVFHYLLKFAQTHVHWIGDAIQSSFTSVSYCHQSLPASGSLPMSQLFASGGQSIRASASSSVLPMNIQGSFPLGLTSLISLQSEGLSRVFSSTTIESINSSLLILLYGPTVTSVHD